MNPDVYSRRALAFFCILFGAGVFGIKEEEADASLGMDMSHCARNRNNFADFSNGRHVAFDVVFDYISMLQKSHVF